MWLLQAYRQQVAFDSGSGWHKTSTATGRSLLQAHNNASLCRWLQDVSDSTQRADRAGARLVICLLLERQLLLTLPVQEGVQATL